MGFMSGFTPQRLVAFIVSIGSAGATILGLYKGSSNAAILGIIGMIFAISLALVIHSAIKTAGTKRGEKLVYIGYALVIFSLAYFIAFTVVLFPWIARQFTDPEIDVAGSWLHSGLELACDKKGETASCALIAETILIV